MTGGVTGQAGLRARLLLSFLVPTLLLLLLLGVPGFLLARKTLEDQLGQSLSAVAGAVAVQVSAERLLALTPEDAAGEGSRTWRSLSRQFNEAKVATGTRRIFAFDREGKARIDAGGGLPLMAEVPELLRDQSELQEVWAGRHVPSQQLFEGTDGRMYKTGYAPLLKDGQVVGAIAVEGNADYFVPLHTLRLGFISLSVLTLLVLAVIAVLNARALSGPIERLVSAALRMGRGDLETKVPSEPGLELGVLARELEAMRQALESRDRQLKMMLGGVAHEVKNPLGGIELFAGLISEELESKAPNLDDARSHNQRVRRELEYLKRIVEDFLSFAREQKLNRAPFGGRGLVQASVDLISGEAQGIGVALLADADDVQLEGDFNLLTSALVNLVKNAVQVSKQGQTVKVTGKKRGGFYVIEVADEGPGIPTELQSRIFEPFFTTKEKGTGLGLALARKLLEAHQGALRLQSKPGATVFTVELPC